MDSQPVRLSAEPIPAQLFGRTIIKNFFNIWQGGGVKKQEGDELGKHVARRVRRGASSFESFDNVVQCHDQIRGVHLELNFIFRWSAADQAVCQATVWLKQVVTTTPSLYH
jgi:hypothetical protein